MSKVRRYIVYWKYFISNKYKGVSYEKKHI